MSICVLCHDCKYWYDDVPCDGVICDQPETGCESCALYRLESPCPVFEWIAPNMDYLGGDIDV